MIANNIIILVKLYPLCHCTEPGSATDIKATVTTRSLAVSWSPPTGEKVTLYQVELKDVANTRKFVSGTSTTFDNLLPGKYYTVVVSSLFGSTLGDPAEGTFTTSKYNYFLFCFICFRCTFCFIKLHTRTYRCTNTKSMSTHLSLIRICPCV